MSGQVEQGMLNEEGVKGSKSAHLDFNIFYAKIQQIASHKYLKG